MKCIICLKKDVNMKFRCNDCGLADGWLQAPIPYSEIFEDVIDNNRLAMRGYLNP